MRTRTVRTPATRCLNDEPMYFSIGCLKYIRESSKEKIATLSGKHIYPKLISPLADFVFSSHMLMHRDLRQKITVQQADVIHKGLCDLIRDTASPYGLKTPTNRQVNRVFAEVM